jgi:hypothetical protein
MSSWWLASEAGAGEAAVEDVVAVVELAEAVSDGSDQVIGVGEGTIGHGGASQHGPDALDRVEVGCLGRQLEDSEPVAVGDVATHASAEVGRPPAKCPWIGSFSVGPLPNRAGGFDRTRLSSDHFRGRAEPRPAWMLWWQAEQTTRVLRRRAAIRVIHGGRSGRPGLLRSASFRRWWT